MTLGSSVLPAAVTVDIVCVAATLMHGDAPQHYAVRTIQTLSARQASCFLLHVLHGVVLQHYAVKTIENIGSQAGDLFSFTCIAWCCLAALCCEDDREHWQPGRGVGQTLCQQRGGVLPGHHLAGLQE